MIFRLIPIFCLLVIVRCQTKTTLKTTTASGIDLDVLIDSLFPDDNENGPQPTPNPCPCNNRPSCPCDNKPTPPVTQTPISTLPTHGSITDFDPFSTPPTVKTTTRPTTPTPKPSQKPTSSSTKNELCKDGECVPFYLCDSNNAVITDGTGVIDVRFGEENNAESQGKPQIEFECSDYLTVCCAAKNIKDTSIITPTVRYGCGYRNRNGVGFKIKGGGKQDSEYGEFPWMVAIVREEMQKGETLSVYQAGGSLIHPKVVLTAAHSVHNRKAVDLKVRLGEWDTQTKNELFPHVERRVVQIITHENFNSGNLRNDIALLILNESVILAENIQTVCLPPKNANFDNSNCFASGWGKDNYGKTGKYQVIMKRVELPTIPFGKCEEIFRTTRLGKRFILDSSFMCAGGIAGMDTCYGDGGSPLVCPIRGHKAETDRYYQAGIVAWGLGCNDPLPGAYANVALFRDWIGSQMKLLKLDTRYYNP